MTVLDKMARYTINGTPVVCIGNFGNTRVFSNGLVVARNGTIVRFDNGATFNLSTGEFVIAANSPYEHIVVCIPPGTQPDIDFLCAVDQNDTDDSGEPVWRWRSELIG